MTDFIHEAPPPENPKPAAPEKPTSEKERQKRVYAYIAVLFTVAFILILWSFLANHRSNQQVIDQLKGSTSMMQSTLEQNAKLVADLISVAGADRVLSMDLHVAQIQGFFNIPVDHLMGTPILAPYFVEKFKNLPREEIAVVSPDLGSVTRARKFAERLDCPLAIIDKRRPRANVSEVMNIIGDVHGKTVVLVDDMVDTAGTLCHGAEALIKLGGAKEVYACATHGVLSGPALQRLTDSVITETVFLDTIPAKEGSEAARIKMLSVAPVFAEAISRIYEGKPVSPLFT